MRPIHIVLQEIMDERHLSIAEIAKLCGLADSTVRGIITRKQTNVALDVAFKLSDGLSVSLHRLNGDINLPQNITALSPLEQAHIKKYRLLNEDDKKKIDTHMDDLLQAAENKKRLADAIKEADARMTSGFTLVAAGGDPQVGVTAPSEDKLLAAIKEAEEIKKRK